MKKGKKLRKQRELDAFMKTFSPDKAPQTCFKGERKLVWMMFKMGYIKWIKPLNKNKSYNDSIFDIMLTSKGVIAVMDLVL